MLPGLVYTDMMINRVTANPGSNTYPAFGSFFFIVPDFAISLVITLYGAGASGLSSTPNWNPGGNTEISLLNLIARGGGANGTNIADGGISSGGDTNLKGNNASQAGSSSPAQSVGATGWDGRGSGGNGQVQPVDPDPKKSGDEFTNYYPGGAAGGKLIKTYYPGELTPGANLTITIGRGGLPGHIEGSNGYASISWT